MNCEQVQRQSVYLASLPVAADATAPTPATVRELINQTEQQLNLDALSRAAKLASAPVRGAEAPVAAHVSIIEIQIIRHRYKPLRPN